MPDAGAVAELLPHLRQIAFGIDQDPAAGGVGVSRAVLERLTGFPAAAVVDDDGTQLAQYGAEQRKLFQMVAGDEGQVVELVVGRETVAPALVFRGDDKGTGRQSITTARLNPDAGENPHGLHHALYIATDDPAGRLASGRKCGKGRRRSIEDRQEPVGDIEGEAAHGATMTGNGPSGRRQAAWSSCSALVIRFRPARLDA